MMTQYIKYLQIKTDYNKIPYVHIHTNGLKYPRSWEFTSGPGDWGSIPGRVIPKTQKMVLDAVLLNTQHYKVRIKSKMEQSSVLSCALRYTSVW